MKKPIKDTVGLEASTRDGHTGSGNCFLVYFFAKLGVNTTLGLGEVLGVFPSAAKEEKMVLNFFTL